MLTVLAVASCEAPLEIVPTSYLAIVTLFDDTTAAGHAAVRYRITELSGTLGIDTVLDRYAGDTVTLDLPPATYTVTVDGLPSTCSIARGTVQYVVVYPPPSTALARYFVLCKPALLLATMTDGSMLDSTFIWRVEGGGFSRSGLIGPNDSVRVDGVPPGQHTVTLGHLAGNCVPISDGGGAQALRVDSSGGAVALFRVACSDPAQRPRLIDYRSSYHGGGAALAFRAVDPNRDIERYVWDLTDCRGTSILPTGSRTRRGLSTGRTALADTVRVVAAFEIGLPDSALVGRCASLRVADEYGNTTPVIEQPLGPDVGTRPVATTFNAIYVGNASVRTTIQGFDADGDFAGYFVLARLRDGVLAPPDGQPDLGVFNVEGYEATPLPELPLGSGRIAFGDVLAVIVYVIDARGHFTRLEDTDLIR